MARNEHELFHIVKLGESLSQIIQTVFGPLSREDLRRKTEQIVKLNPHIKNPDLIYPGGIVCLGSPARQIPGKSVLEHDMIELERIVRQTSPETLQTIEKNFDVLDWLLERVGNTRDVGEFFEGTGRAFSGTLSKVSPYRIEMTLQEVIELSTVYKSLAVVRKETVTMLNSIRVSVSRMPVLVLSVSSNGLYSYANKLTKLIDLAEKFKFGRKLLIADGVIEGAKAAAVYARTRDLSKTAQQGVKGAARVGAGLSSSLGASWACGGLIAIGPAGWMGCGFVFGLASWKGADAGEAFVTYMFGFPDLP